VWNQEYLCDATHVPTKFFVEGTADTTAILSQLDPLAGVEQEINDQS
jgi:hypothetical protein